MREITLFLLPYYKRKIHLLIPMIVFIIVSALAQTFIPLEIRNVIDNTLSSIQQTSSQELLVRSMLIILGLGVIDWTSEMVARLFNNRFNQGIQYDIRQDIYKKLQEQELEFYSKESIGQIMARTVEEVNSLRELLGWGLRIFLLVSVLYLSAFVIMLQTSPRLAGVYFLMVPIVIFVLAKLSKKNAEIFYQTKFKYGKVNEVMAESYSGIKTIKSFGRELEQIEEFNEVNLELYKAVLRELGVRSTLQPMMILFINISLLIVLFLAGAALQISALTSGEFIAFMLLTINVTNRGRFLGDLAIAFQMGNAAARRLKEVLESEVPLKEKPDAEPLAKENFELVFEHVSYKYPDSKYYALEEVSFRIPMGQKVALLGSTGSGKSTLINLIPRFYDPTEGRILIGNKDLRDLRLRELRRLVGIVHQESFLFTMSIRDNIAFGHPDASLEEIVRAAKSAQIHEYIETLEDGYDTIVGERGVTLSGGQRQRIAIARALLSDPKILIFDDSVSAVDPETEAKLQETLSKAGEDRTIVVISQRPSSLKYVDRILVLYEGKIVQDGTHQDLVQIPGIYREFMEAVKTQVKFMSWDTEVKEEMVR